MVQHNPQSSGRIVAGRYRLGPRLGSGVDVAAFEAFDEQLQKMVVLKVLHPELGDAPQVRREFRAAMAVAAGVDHPNVAPILDFGSDRWGPRDVLFVVTERVGGGSLRDMLDRGRLLAPSQALIVGLEACRALDAVHRAGIVHSDIRPSTVAFADDRRVQLLDVGLAQLLASVGGGAAARDNDRVRYASPESALGQPLGPKSDVYSLCLTLIEALSGTVPFEGDSSVATLANRVDKLMPVSADLGPLAAVLERAGRPLPADRYTAAEFGRALVQAAEKLPRPAPLPTIGNSLFSVDPTPSAAPAPTVPASPTAPTQRIPAPFELPEDTISFEALPPSRPPRSARPERGARGAVAARVDELPEDDLRSRAFRDDELPEGDLDDYPEPPAPKSPNRLRLLLVAVLLVVAAAGGGLAWYLTRPEKITVPDLSGQQQAAALTQIEGLFKGTVQTELSEDVAAGIVIRTDPAAGSTANKGSGLTVYVSSGAAPRVLPELKGLTLDEAKAKLDPIGLVLKEGPAAYDDTVAVGKIVSWSVPTAPTLAAGGSVPKGSTVEVVVSKGVSPLEVPDVRRQTVAAATTSLQAKGFVVKQGAGMFDDTVPAGQVVAQSLPPGTHAVKGATITLYASKGPQNAALPDPKGLNYNAIVAALQAAGFTVGPVNGNAALAFVGYQVNGVQVAAGTLEPKGTTVGLIFKSK